MTDDDDNEYSAEHQDEYRRLWHRDAERAEKAEAERDRYREALERIDAAPTTPLSYREPGWAYARMDNYMAHLARKALAAVGGDPADGAQIVDDFSEDLRKLGGQPGMSHESHLQEKVWELEAEVDRYREALEEILEVDVGTSMTAPFVCRKIAREALAVGMEEGL